MQAAPQPSAAEFMPNLQGIEHVLLIDGAYL
jgi:hypothetical protein